MPGVLSAAVSSQTGAPVLQLVEPTRQAVGLPLQVEPLAHVTHCPPPLHTWFKPQLTPAGLLAASTQVWAPVSQRVEPTRQMPGFEVQLKFGVQLTQLPVALQTRLVPQAVPAAFWVPFAQLVTPLVQAVTPVKQGFGLPLQLWPEVQLPQKPMPSHCWPAPQAVPIALGAPSTQVEAPVAHEVRPSRHVLGLPVHAWPAVQLTHAPEPLHTWLVPQTVPAGLLPLSVQTGAPVMHEITPVLQPVGLAVQL